jgi:hypothetical protein
MATKRNNRSDIMTLPGLERARKSIEPASILSVATNLLRCVLAGHAAHHHL